MHPAFMTVPILAEAEAAKPYLKFDQIHTLLLSSKVRAASRDIYRSPQTIHGLDVFVVVVAVFCFCFVVVFRLFVVFFFFLKKTIIRKSVWRVSPQHRQCLTRLHPRKPDTGPSPRNPLQYRQPARNRKWIARSSVLCFRPKPSGTTRLTKSSPPTPTRPSLAFKQNERSACARKFPRHHPRSGRGL